MNVKKSESVSTYHQYLPAILQKDVFIGRFLLAFEKILRGLDETPSQEQIITADERKNTPGLEEIIDKIHLYFNPGKTPEEFLPWLAGWVALSLRNDWRKEVKAAFIQKIVKLYRLRGTKQGLIEILTLYLENSELIESGEKVQIFDQFEHFPHYFQVQITLNNNDTDQYWRQAKIAKAIIDQEKPAQTFYTLKILVPTMQLTLRSQVAYYFQLSAPFTMVEKLELTAIVEINQPNAINADLLNKITVRLQDNFSGYHLLTPTTIIENNKIIIKRTLYPQRFPQTLDQLAVTIKNLNNTQISGKVIVQVELNTNQSISTNTLIEKTFDLTAVNPAKILQIYSKNLVSGNTKLGTV